MKQGVASMPIGITEDRALGEIFEETDTVSVPSIGHKAQPYWVVSKMYVGHKHSTAGVHIVG